MAKNVDISSISKFITPGKEKQAQQIANDVAKKSSGSSSKNKNSAGQTAPIGPNDPVTAENYQSVLNYLSPYMTDSAKKTVKSGGQPVSFADLNKMVSSPVTTTDLTTPVQPITYPEAPVTPVAPVSPVTTTTTPETDSAKLFESYLTAKSENQMPSLAEEYTAAEKAAKIRQKQDRVNDLQSQVNTIVAQQNADILSARQQSSTEGGTTGILSAREDAINRSAAIKALPIQAQLSAAQDDLKTAQERLQTLFDIKVQDAQNQYEYKNKIIDAVYSFATEEQKNKLDDRRREEDRQFDLFSSQIDNINALSRQAASDGNWTLASKYAEYAGSLDYKTYNPSKVTGGLNRIASNYGGGTTSAPEIDRVIDINGVQTPVDKYGNVIKISGAPTSTSGGQTPAQLELMTKTLENVFGSSYDAQTGKFTPDKDKEALYKYSGQAPIIRGPASWFGVTKFQQLQNYADTLKTNMLTLATDPSIKKFFGPQMSNADVKLMMSGGTTLDPEAQTPEQFKAEALRIGDFIARANKAVSDGMKGEMVTQQPESMVVGDITYTKGADGLYYAQ